MTIPLSIDRDRSSDGHAHQDIAVTVGETTFRADSCYFGLEANDYTGSSIDRIMLAMFDRWLADLRSIQPDGGSVYFPVSFDDQGSLWVATDSIGPDRVAVCLGESSLEGWAFMPTEYADSVNRLGSWRTVSGSSFECSTDDLIEQVASIRSTYK